MICDANWHSLNLEMTTPGHPSAFFVNLIEVVLPTQNQKSYARTIWLHFPTLWQRRREKPYLRNGPYLEWWLEWHLIFHSFFVSDLCNRVPHTPRKSPQFRNGKNRKSDRNSEIAICRLKEISGLLCGTFYGCAVARSWPCQVSARSNDFITEDIFKSIRVIVAFDLWGEWRSMKHGNCNNRLSSSNKAFYRTYAYKIVLLNLYRKISVGFHARRSINYPIFQCPKASMRPKLGH